MESKKQGATLRNQGPAAALTSCAPLGLLRPSFVSPGAFFVTEAPG